MTLLRALASSQVTISHTFYVDETPTDADDSVAVSVKRLDGTVVASGTAAHPGAPGVYTYAVPAQPSVDIVTVDWTGHVAGATVTSRDHVELVGGFLFGLAEARSMPPVLDPTRFPTGMLAAHRIAVEQECERICGRAFVPRFRREKVRIINNTVMPTEVDVRAIRSVTLAGQPYTGWYWPDRRGPLTNIAHTRVDDYDAVIEYEYGMDYPPEEIRTAAMLRLRTRLTAGDNGIPSRAVSFSVTDGGVYRLATPGEKRTGVPEVDAAYQRYALDVWGFA